MSEERQTQSMIDFIDREAREKVDELDQAAQEEYDVEKMRLVESEKSKIRTSLENRKKQVEVDRRVARANHSKTQHIRLMEERALILEKLRESTHNRITAVISDAGRYRPLVSSLLRQAAAAVATDALVDCRPEDEGLVSSLISDTTSWYQAERAKATSGVSAADESKAASKASSSNPADHQQPLIPATRPLSITLKLARTNLKGEDVWGGVIMRSADGRIVCNNTLAARLDHCFHEQMPRIRYTLLNPDGAGELEGGRKKW